MDIDDEYGDADCTSIPNVYEMTFTARANETHTKPHPGGRKRSINDPGEDLGGF
jgi:hypothetical protein